MSLANYDNTRSKTGDINSIPDEILMEWCRYLSHSSRVNFALTCNRIAWLEREAGERIVGKLDMFTYNQNISLTVNSRRWKPEQALKWLSRARIREFKIMNMEEMSEEYFSQFIPVLSSIRYQSLSVTLTKGDYNQHIDVLNTLINNRDISGAKFTLKWNCAHEKHNIKYVKEWLLEMPMTKSLTIEWEELSPSYPVDTAFDDSLLYHLARNTTALDLSMPPGIYSMQGLANIWELFRDTDLREVHLSTTIDVAEQLAVLHGNYANPCFRFNFEKDLHFRKAFITMVSTANKIEFSQLFPMLRDMRF